MFRATSKKRKKTVTRLRSASDDEEEPKATDTEEKKSSRIKTKSKKSKKKKGMVVRSFEQEEGHDDEGPFQATKKEKSTNRKRKRGLGFGGASVVVHDEDDFGMPNHEVTGSGSANVYGKEAMEKLKQEQAYKAYVVMEESNTSDVQKAESQPSSMPPHSQQNLEEMEPQLGDYISLNEKQPNLILTGDEALDFENRKNVSDPDTIKKEDHFNTVMEDSNFLNDSVDQQQAEETSAWEAEITRRAGVSESKQSNGYQGRDNRKIKSATTSSAMSLAKLRSQIQSTISQLETQDNDVDRACERRKIELKQTKVELDRQEKELNESGEALENYQRLREQLTFWTGALRDLKSKVQPIQDALVDLDADIVKCPQWCDWEDDMCAVLHQAGMLDRVLGRQPPDFVFEDTTTFVDEFGRDVKSQHAMNREKRTRRRLEIQQNRDRALEEDDSDAGMDEDDIDAFRERRLALAKALELALQELDEEYTQLPKLASVFREWQQSHSDDFKQCFANLSFGDLASVLVQVELCKGRTSNQSWQEGSKSDDNGSFAWIAELANADDDDAAKANGTPANEVIDRIIEKSYVPLISTILDKGSYSVVSTTQTRALSSLYSKLCKLSESRSNPQLESLTRQLLDYIKTSLGGAAIVILNNNNGTHANGKTEDEDSSQSKELSYSVLGATEGQLKRITKMLVNVVAYWAPYLSAESGSDVAGFLLDFLSGKYLFLLSSLKSRTHSTKESFSKIWEVVRETKWLDQDGRMLQAAPLRAAAAAFDLK